MRIVDNIDTRCYNIDIRYWGDWMAKKSLEILTETMFYVLMALLKGEMCGTEIAVYIEEKTKERIKLGPGTLYTILAKFEEEELIEETSVIGRKRNYRITEKGLDVYFEELERLKLCVSDGESEVAENEKNIPDRFK